MVTLTAEGLPTGVTATFAPATLVAGVTSGTLTLAIGATSPAATSSFTIRASGTGVVAQTATVALTITATIAPDFSLTATPASLPITAGQSGTSAVTIARSGGFVGNVQLTLEGTPAGLTGTFAPNPASAGTSTLTVAATAATAPGTYNLTIRGTSAAQTDRTTALTVVVSAAPAISLAVGTPTLAAAIGATATSTITIARVGGFAGDVALTLDAPPTGITGVFTPPTILAANSTSSLTLTIGATATPGSYALTVRGTGTGISAQTATIALTVSAAPNFTMTASAVTTAQGTTGTSTVTLTRTGGFAGAVALAVSGFPAGVTATFNPASATGATSSLSLAVTSAVAVGTYTGTVTGTAAGIANVTTPLTLTVTAGAVGPGAISWRFCDPAQYPVWFAFRSGTSGAFTRVIASANQTYNFTIAAAVGVVAYAQPNVDGGPARVTVNFATTTELQASGSAECATNRPTKTLTGTVAGLSSLQTASVNYGGGFASVVFPTTSFRVTQAAEGPTDLLAFRSTQSFAAGVTSVVPDRALLRRNLNYPANGVIPVVDLSGTESFAVQAAQITTANSGSDAVSVYTSFGTNNGLLGGFFNFGATSGGRSPFTVYGIPSAQTQSGDLHLIIAAATNLIADGVGTSRFAAQYNRDLNNRTLTFGPNLSLPMFVTLATLPYARLQGSGVWQAEYGDQLTGTFTQSIGGGSFINADRAIRSLRGAVGMPASRAPSLAGGTRSWTLIGSRGYFGTATGYSFDTPDFSAVPGFDVSWGLQGDALTNVTALGIGYFGSNRQIVEGASLRAATVLGIYQP